MVDRDARRRGRAARGGAGNGGADGRAERVKDKGPVVLDARQPFLRELRPDDLNGAAAVFRIKEEMRTRATQALGAGMVKDVLIQDLVQQ